jgi:hypothetical protein
MKPYSNTLRAPSRRRRPRVSTHCARIWCPDAYTSRSIARDHTKTGFIKSLHSIPLGTVTEYDRAEYETIFQHTICGVPYHRVSYVLAQCIQGMT